MTIIIAGSPWIDINERKREQAAGVISRSLSFIDPKMKNHGNPKVCPWFGRLTVNRYQYKSSPRTDGRKK